MWGGTSLSYLGADCSGFTQAVYSHAGISAPRTSEAQGAWVKRGGPVPGGLAFYHSPAGGADPGHVAIVADASAVVSQGGGMGPKMEALHFLPLLWTGTPPGGFPAGSGGGASPGGAMSAAMVAALWDQMGGNPGAAANMARIAYAESGDDPSRVQSGMPPGLTGYGLYQITPTSGITQGGAFGNLLNAANNTRAAISLFNGSGYLPWAADPVASALVASGLTYARGGKIAGSVPGYASGGSIGTQGAAYLKAWQTRHGGGFGAGWGPVVINQQIAAMAAALANAQTLSKASLPSSLHKHYVAIAADEKKRLATLNTELTTERAWRGQLSSSDAALASWVKAAGSSKTLAPSVKKWKAAETSQGKTIDAISKMLGYSNAEQAKLAAAAHAAAIAGGAGITRTFGGDVTDTTGEFLKAALSPFRAGGLIADRGTVLAPGWNARYNGTGRPEPLVPAGGGGDIHLHLTVNAPVGSQAQLEDWFVKTANKAAQHGRLTQAVRRAGG